MQSFIYYGLVIAGCIVAASLFTSLIAWRGRESNRVYGIVFIVMSLVFVSTAMGYLFPLENQPSTFEQWQLLYDIFMNDSGADNCQNNG